MTITKMLGAASLVSLSFVFGCAAQQSRAATIPVGHSTTTGALICPDGYVATADETRCVLPEPAPAVFDVP